MKNYWKMSAEEKRLRKELGWTDEDIREFERLNRIEEEMSRKVLGDEEYERMMDNPE